jgi:hypothetical protein
MRTRKRRTSKRACARAARTTLRAHLDWLNGYPSDDLRWQSVPSLCSRSEVHSRTLDASQIRAASHALKSIQRRFPKALPEIVGPVELWATHITEKLDHLKEMLRGQPSADWRALARDNQWPNSLQSLAQKSTRFAPLLTAIAWYHWRSHKQIEQALNFIRQFHSPLQTLQSKRKKDFIPLTLQLIQLHSHHHSLITAILEQLGDPELWSIKLSELETLGALKKTFKKLKHRSSSRSSLIFNRPWKSPAPVTLPCQMLLDTVLDQCRAVAARSVKDQKNYLTVAQALMAGIPSQPWRGYWERLGDLESRLRQLWYSIGHNKQDPLSRPGNIEKQIQKLEASRPTAYRLGEVSHELTLFVKQIDNPASHALTQLLPRLPKPERAPFFIHWNYECHQPDGASAAILNGLCRLFPSRAAIDAWSQWSDWSIYRLSTEISDCLSNDHGHIQCSQLARILETIPLLIQLDSKNDRAATPRDFSLLWEPLLALTEKLSNSHEVALFLRAIPDNRRARMSDKMIPALLAICQRSPERFARILTAWQKRSWRVLELLAPVLEQHAELCPFLSELLTDSKGISIEAPLMRLALSHASHPTECSEIIKQWLNTQPEPAAVPPHYPPELHKEISSILESDPRARRSLKKILGRDFPDPAQLRKEIEFLTGHSSDQQNLEIKQRLKNLKRRMSHPPQVSALRMKSLKNQLARRLRQTRLKALDAALRPLLPNRQRQELLDPRTLNTAYKYLLAFSRLKPAFVKLAHKVIKRRMTENSWDFNEHPENQRFVQSMSALGLKLEPWLYGDLSMTKEEQGLSVTVSLERDPLEVFQMGAAFNTCLAPRDCNFFSVLANFVDANKQVIYARDAAGTIQARCLVALASTGGLLLYHVYKHHLAWVEGLVLAFIDQLAERMGTVLVSAGQPRRLVSPDWYDDGPQTRLKISQKVDDQDLTQGLRTLPLNEVVGATQAAFAPLRMSGPVLNALFRAEVFTERKELYRPFFSTFPELKDNRHLHLHFMKFLINDKQQQALRALLPIIESRGSWKAWNIDDQCLLAQVWLDQGSPSRARRFLLACKKFNGSWEYHFCHQLLWAEVLIALHRLKDAAQALKGFNKQSRVYPIENSQQRVSRIRSRLQEAGLLEGAG